MKNEKRKTKPRIVGIDYGMARLGVAISDESRIIASPLMTITAERKLEATVDKVIGELQKLIETHNYQIAEIVVGMPLSMNGKMSLSSDEVTHFVSLLQEKWPHPIITWDERLTTVQAERTLREANMSRKKRAKVIDTVAATIILQNYLDRESCKL